MKDTSPHPQPTRKRGDGGIFLRGRTYWIRYSYRGEPQRESSHSTNPEVAEGHDAATLLLMLLAIEVGSLTIRRGRS